MSGYRDLSAPHNRNKNPQELFAKWRQEDLDDFFSAVCGGNTNRLNQLLDDRSLLRKINWQGNTGLHCAAKHGQAEIIKILIAHGADPRILNTNGKTAEEIAADTLQPNILNLLHPRKNEDFYRFFHAYKKLVNPEAMNQKIAKEVKTSLQGKPSAFFRMRADENKYLLNNDVVNLITEYASF